MEFNGFLNVLKPPGVTSHDIVKHIRFLAPGVKVGHGGTLDPGAAGVLPILMGKATRLSSYLVDLTKIYRAELYLGVNTDTEDSSGEVLSRTEVPSYLEKAEIENALQSFQGELLQLPPMYAAVKEKGKKLYDYARSGVTVERTPREVNIYSTTFIDYFPPHRIIFDVECSKGTYIRTLCAQIGEFLGLGGHMSFLVRKGVGPLSLTQSFSLKEIEYAVQQGKLHEILLPLDIIFGHLEPLCLDYKNVRALSQGQKLPFNKIASFINKQNEVVDEKLAPVYTTQREFVLLARWIKKDSASFILKPEKVFNL